MGFCGVGRVGQVGLWGWTVGQQGCLLSQSSPSNPPSNLSNPSNPIAPTYPPNPTCPISPISSISSTYRPYESDNAAWLSKLESLPANPCLGRYNCLPLKVILDWTHSFLNIMSGFILAMSGPQQQLISLQRVRLWESFKARALKS